MKLQRLRVEQFRQFRQPLELADFKPGINLFVGPNESGKSTLVRAIRAAFFERHQTSGVNDLQPWNDMSAAPQVELDFEYQGQHWRLSKRFLLRKRCDLTIDGVALSGEEAEDKLAAMLGFQFPGRGASKAEHWGIPGLLWIEQGAGHELRAAVSHAGDHLKSALSASLGPVASSGGDEVISAVQEQRGVLLTKTGRPTGEYADIMRRLSEQQAAVRELDEKITVYRHRVDRLAELNALQQRDDAEKPWETLRRQQAAAQDAFTSVQQLSQQQGADQQALDSCTGNIDLVNSHLLVSQKLHSDLKARQQAHDEAQMRVTQSREALAPLQTALVDARTAYAAAQAYERQARRQARREELGRELHALQQQLANANEHRVAAREIHDGLRVRQEDLAAAAIDAAELAQLKKLDDRRKEVLIRQQSIATRLRFDLVAGQTLKLDGQRLADSGEQLLLRETELAIPGVGRLQIIPGGQDLGELDRELVRLNDACGALLARMRAESREHAEQRAERCRVLESAIANDQKLFASHAPQGLEALEVEQRARRQRVQQLEEELNGLIADDTLHADAESNTDGAPQCITAPFMRPEEAAQALRLAESRLKDAEHAEKQQQLLIVRAEQALASAIDEHRALQISLDDPQRRQQQNEFARRLVELRAQEASLKQQMADRAERIQAANPDMLQLDIQRFKSSADEAQAVYNKRELERIEIRAQLGALDADGLEEQRARSGSELESLERRHAELERRARALDLLASLLVDKRQTLTRRLQAPLQKHLNHYLQLLFPQAALEVDEHLAPGTLKRKGAHGMEAGNFDELSFGAREQTGLISRLAYADLLKESGKPTLIILDDALVHTDPRRLEQMKRILFDAAQRHQILLFSCHPDNWRDLGVAATDLQSLKSGAGPV